MKTYTAGMTCGHSAVTCEYAGHIKYSCAALQASNAAARPRTKGKKKARASSAAANTQAGYPFVLTKEQQSNISHTLASVRDEGAHIPRGWSSLNLQHCFAHPSWLKAHDWLLLAGPVGKYALQARHLGHDRHTT